MGICSKVLRNLDLEAIVMKLSVCFSGSASFRWLDGGDRTFVSSVSCVPCNVGR